MPEKVGKVLLIITVFLSLCMSGGAKQCIDSKVGSPCLTNEDCFYYEEFHLYCNKTRGVNICGFQVESYAGQAEVDRDCPGEEFSAEAWSNPVGDDVMLDNSTGIDCLRWCYFTETCFAVVVRDHKCYLRNDKCFSNLRDAPGAVLGVMSVLREDYHCGCHYPFTRKRSNGHRLSWTPDCPESQLDRNPYRCCSPKGLCVKCVDGNTPPPPVPRNDLHLKQLP
ncbi:hypothetical protein Fcan01_13746 [Folsomia candida]|uniref:Uncharacterized protein n=2 Tax=Folsomia candida TaxID=158441 RepID=A0A226E2V7_FOLCA|nr:hypothetical protein Fcan01_13746 [Folsomia candida]